MILYHMNVGHSCRWNCSDHFSLSQIELFTLSTCKCNFLIIRPFIVTTNDTVWFSDVKLLNINNSKLFSVQITLTYPRLKLIYISNWNCSLVRSEVVHWSDLKSFIGQISSFYPVWCLYEVFGCVRTNFPDCWNDSSKWFLARLTLDF